MKDFIIQITKVNSASADLRNSVKITKSKLEKIREELNQYYDKNGYLSWSERKKKYVILGTNSPVNGGLVNCPHCHVGKLLIIRSRISKKRFIGCSNYYNGCKASSPLIQKGTISTTKISCKVCFWPIIFFRYSRKQRWTGQCSNFHCQSRISKS